MQLPRPSERYDARNEAAARDILRQADAQNIKRDRPVAVTGSRAGGDALESLLAALVEQGVIVDRTDP